MKITNTKLCNSSIYITHGFLIDEINFDVEFYKELMEDSSLFYAE